ncbi:Trk system potassium transporter TrkA [Chitinivorax sp. B]|uniref:Trk system potassium transporter TrkA n=1 Tax=Chitinivorax sp. B TaxID=2502235 RepID=UPI0010F65EF6|nr:Trk system potassium transporter TrkA [Chitinivorax sp. B]
MKILIVGGGRVGASAAEYLVREDNDITVIDHDEACLKHLQSRFDLRTIVGSAANPAVLEQASAADADLLLALTPNDEMNLVVCQLCRVLYQTTTRIARVRSSGFARYGEDFLREHFGVHRVICPEEIVTDYLDLLLDYPEALQVIDLAGGKLRLLAVKVRFDGMMVGKKLKDIRQHLGEIDCRVAVIYRGERPIFPSGDTKVQEGDEVFFMASTENLEKVLREWCGHHRKVKRVIIAGGGNIGYRLARQRERDCNVKIIEHNVNRASWLAEHLHQTLVFQGDATDEKLLDTENIDETDVFLALTNDDEDNLMSAMLAKRMGARKTISLINRAAYVDVAQGSRIDIAISPAQRMIGPLLATLRRGDVVGVHSLRHGLAEVIEAVAHGDRDTSHLSGRRIADVDLPAGCVIGALVRGEQVIMAHGETVIADGDRVILFVDNRRMIPKVEKLFQVKLGFL